MDLETENRLAALLMEEARKARIQADKEGVHAYLQKPNVRARPNSRFLTATVLGVQQANRVVEVSEMWNAREKELELDAKLKGRSKSTSIHNDQRSHQDSLRICSSSRHKGGSRNSINPSNQRAYEHFYSDEVDDINGLKDEEVEEFLRARAKRGRGAIGSRMDEPGPYMSPGPSGQATVNPEMRVKEEWESRILGPEKPSFVMSKSSKSSEDVSEVSDDHENSKRHRSEHKRHRSEHTRSKKEKEGKAARKAKSSKHRHKRRRKE